MLGIIFAKNTDKYQMYVCICIGIQYVCLAAVSINIRSRVTKTRNAMRGSNCVVIKGVKKWPSQRKETGIRLSSYVPSDVHMWASLYYIMIIACEQNS